MTTKQPNINVTRQRLTVLAEDTRTRMKRSASDIYCIGANLLEAQDLLAHGEFLPWIKAEFGMGKTSAYKFMDVAKRFQGKLPQNGNLEISAAALYLLASASTPEEARAEALELAAGKTVDLQKAKQLIAKYTPNCIEQPIQGITTKVNGCLRRDTENTVAIGEELISVKERLGPGRFEAWLKAEFDWDKRTAQRFMSVAAMFKSTKFVDLNIPPSALYLLAAPSTPNEVRQAALNKARSGEQVTHEWVEKFIEAFNWLR